MSKRICPVHGIYEKISKQDMCPKCKSKTDKDYNRFKRDKASTKIYNSSRWRKDTRPTVLVRDNFMCVECGYPGKSINLIVDHIEEIKDGGDPYRIDNLQTLCRACHNTKTEDEKKKRSESDTSTGKKKSDDHGFRFL